MSTMMLVRSDEAADGGAMIDRDGMRRAQRAYDTAEPPEGPCEDCDDSAAECPCGHVSPHAATSRDDEPCVCGAASTTDTAAGPRCREHVRTCRACDGSGQRVGRGYDPDGRWTHTAEEQCEVCDGWGDLGVTP